MDIRYIVKSALILIIAISFYSCIFESNHPNSPSVSENLQFSKANNFFIKKCRIEQISDTFGFEIKDTWLEKSWKYIKQKPTEIGGVQLVFEINFFNSKFEPKKYHGFWEFSSVNKVKFGTLGYNIYWAIVNVDIETFPISIEMYNKSNVIIDKKLAFVLKTE